MWADFPQHLPASERAWKQLRHGAWLVSAWTKQRRRPPVVYVWPDMPSRRAALHKVTRFLGWELTNCARTSAVLGIHFEDATQKQRSAPPQRLKAYRWWNAHCADIGKQALEHHHVHAFGYGMSVDPSVHVGPVVVKSDENAKHDGQIVHGPIPAASQRADAVYQRVIENTDEAGAYFDYRVVYMQGEFPVVYRKFKDAAKRFTNETVEVDLLDTTPFTESELQAMRSLANLMSIDYAEFDALRDRASGKLFVVDVNPTPWGPPAQLDAEGQRTAISLMANCLESLVQPSNK